MFKTHGGENSKRFSCSIEGENLVLQRLDQTSQETKTLTFGIREIVEIVSWLHGKFTKEFFPIGNTQDSTHPEKLGLAMAILQVYPNDKLHAAGAPCLAVVLENIGIFQWNSKDRGIEWKIAKEIHTPNELKLLLQAFINGHQASVS